MKNILTTLDSSEAILLMYLADELSSSDKEQVNRMLQKDGALRARLGELKWSLELLHQGLNQQDAQSPTTNVDRAVHATLSAMTNWTARATYNAQAKSPQAAKLPLPWWCYPLAAAAALLVAAAVFFANMEPGAMMARSEIPTQQTQTYDPSNWRGPRVEPLNPQEAAAVADDLVATLDDSSILIAEADGHLASAGRELDALRDLSRSFASAEFD